MGRLCKVTLNKETFHLNCGDLLLDGALLNGVELPHDCRSGICGACRVKLVDGKVFGGTEHGSDMIHACQARVVSDLKLVREAVPDPVSIQAEVADLVRLAPDVVGVSLALPRRLKPWGAALTAIGFLTVAGLSLFHVGVEQHWWQGLAACSGNLDTHQSVTDLEKQLMSTPVTPCDRPAWTGFGISMAGYDFIYAGLVGMIGLFLALRSAR